MNEQSMLAGSEPVSSLHLWNDCNIKELVEGAGIPPIQAKGPFSKYNGRCNFVKFYL